MRACCEQVCKLLKVNLFFPLGSLRGEFPPGYISMGRNRMPISKLSKVVSSVGLACCVLTLSLDPGGITAGYGHIWG